MFLFIFFIFPKFKTAHWRVDILMTIWVCPFATLAQEADTFAQGASRNRTACPLLAAATFEHAGVPCRFDVVMDRLR